MTVRTDERSQFLFDVFVTALEGGIGYWSVCEKYHNHTGKGSYGEDAISDFYAVISDSEGDDFADERIDIDVIARGIGLFVKYVRGTDDGKPLAADHYWRQFLEANDSNGDEGDYDADVADAIVQFGLFGEVVYG